MSAGFRKQAVSHVFWVCNGEGCIRGAKGASLTLWWLCQPVPRGAVFGLLRNIGPNTIATQQITAKGLSMISGWQWVIRCSVQCIRTLPFSPIRNQYSLGPGYVRSTCQCFDHIERYAGSVLSDILNACLHIEIELARQPIRTYSATLETLANFDTNHSDSLRIQLFIQATNWEPTIWGIWEAHDGFNNAVFAWYRSFCLDCQKRTGSHPTARARWWGTAVPSSAKGSDPKSTLTMLWYVLSCNVARQQMLCSHSC